MAHPSVLNKAAAIELAQAVNTLEELLPEEDHVDVHENLLRVRNDAVGRSDKNYQMAVLLGGLSRVVAAQQEEIDRLGRVKANAAALSSKAGGS
jgi:hypothetical protein